MKARADTPAASSPGDVGAATCPRCGVHVATDATVCSLCDEPLGDIEARPSTWLSRNWVLVSLGVIYAVALVMVVVVASA